MIELDTPCIVPPNRPEPDGYVKISVGGHNYSAHRLAWEIAYGVIPRGMTVDHLCVNPSCVNVLHMELVTHGENVARGWRRGSHVFPERCPKDHEPDFRVNPAGHRICRACKREAKARLRAKRRAAA